EANSEGARFANTQSNHSANSKRSQQGDVMPETQRRNRFETAGAGGGSLLGSAALIGIGALIEPELLGGMLLGAGAVYLARNIPVVGGILRPVVSKAVKTGYSVAMKANELIAEAGEDLQDMVADARTDFNESSSMHRE